MAPRPLPAALASLAKVVDLIATRLYFREASADTHRGTNSNKLTGTATPWVPHLLSTTAGAGLTTAPTTSSVTGPTAGIEFGSGGAACHEWITPPFDSDVTIADTITANLWMSESNMSANVAAQVVIDILRADGSTITALVTSTRTTEVAVTTRAVNNFTTGMTSGGYTSQTVNKGDRLRIRPFGDDAGTMASGFTFSFGYDGGTGGADGDSWVEFTETITFSSAPSGSTLYLTDTASDVTTASVDREAWTSRGAGVQTDVRSTTAGFTAPLQWTDTAGGTVVDWFTKQLNAFTLGGMAQFNIRCARPDGSTDVSVKAEIARVDSDGTNPTVWGSWCIEGESTADVGFLAAVEAVRTAWVSGDDLSVSDGQRLRLRLYIDDLGNRAMTTGKSITLWYAGTSGGASGDTYVILPQTVTEFAAGPATSLPFVRRAGSSRLRDPDPGQAVDWR